MTDVKLKHPDSKQTVTVRDEDADLYRSQGWSEDGKAADPRPQIVTEGK